MSAYEYSEASERQASQEIVIMAHVNCCQFAFNRASLASKFGRELAQLWFGFDNEIIESLVGRYSRGKNKGQLRGEITWEKCVRGGWNGNGVTLPGKIRNRQIVIAGFVSGRGYLAKPAEIIYSESN